VVLMSGCLRCLLVICTEKTLLCLLIIVASEQIVAMIFLLYLLFFSHFSCLYLYLPILSYVDRLSILCACCSIMVSSFNKVLFDLI